MREIEHQSLGGILAVDQDGSLLYMKDGTSDEEALTEEQALQRWPDLRPQIEAAIQRVVG